MQNLPAMVDPDPKNVDRDLDDIATWQFELPPELIAARPTSQRDGGRLLVVRRQTGQIEHRQIVDLPDILQTGDRLVFNNTKVLPARLFGFRTSTGGRWEGLFLEQSDDERWRITGQTRGRLQPDECLTIVQATEFSPSRTLDDYPAATTLQLRLTERCSDGSWLAAPDSNSQTLQLLEEFGTLPLPPYIGRKVADSADSERYQTVFASQTGAIAAPTAGLHFTPDLLSKCSAQGISRSEVTLHVGIGTFRPVSTDRLSEHQMHSEWCRVTAESAAAINATKASGNNVVAVGTTSVRTLEASAGEVMSQDDGLNEWQGATNLFIQPGYRFRAVDQLLTNFHLPGSTLIVLVAALAGYDLTMEAYRKAVEEKYRFYSYGDAMLIL